MKISTRVRTFFLGDAERLVAKISPDLMDMQTECHSDKGPSNDEID